jgi:hypothetical protein
VETAPFSLMNPDQIIAEALQIGLAAVKARPDYLGTAYDIDSKRYDLATIEKAIALHEKKK